MADVIARCPHCGSSLRLRAESAGRKVMCPSCRKTFVAPASAVRGKRRPARRCPGCGSALPAGAVRCRECDYDLVTGRRRDRTPTVGWRRARPRLSDYVPTPLLWAGPVLVVCLAVWWLVVSPLGRRFKAQEAFGLVLRGRLSEGAQRLAEARPDASGSHARQLDVRIAQAQLFEAIDVNLNSPIPCQVMPVDSLQAHSDGLVCVFELSIGNRSGAPLRLSREYFLLRAMQIVREQRSSGTGWDMGIRALPGPRTVVASRAVEAGSSERTSVDGLVVPPGQEARCTLAFPLVPLASLTATDCALTYADGARQWSIPFDSRYIEAGKWEIPLPATEGQPPS